MGEHRVEILPDMTIEWDVPIPMDDGVVLRADVFRPNGTGRHPVIMTHGPYGKNLSFSQGWPTQFNALTTAWPEVLEGSSGRFHVWETVDPEKWVPEGRYQQGDSALPLVPFTSTRPIVTVDPLKFRRTNFKAGLEFDAAPQSMLYATYVTGFKGGGFSLTISCGAEEFSPETVEALTLGSRNRFADNKVQLNIEAYQWKYKDQQTSYIGQDGCGVTTLLTRNVGNATIRGLSTDLTVKPTPLDTVRLAVEYNHSRYDDFSNSQFGIGSYAAAGGSRCTPTATGGGFFNIDCSGLPLPRTPRWSGSASAEHVFELGGAGDLRLTGDMVFASSRWLSIDYVPNGRDDAYQTYNAALEYRPASGNFSLTAFMNNITDTAVYTGGSSIPFAAPNGFNYFAANILPPRTYGLRARVDF